MTLPDVQSEVRIPEAKQHIPLVDLGRQTAALEVPLRQAIWGVCERGDFILGGEVERFEHAFAHFLGANEAVGVASGLDALSLSLQALGVEPGDEVIVPVNSFMATGLAVSKIGATPVFVDCQWHDMNIDVEQLEKRITDRTKAIIPVHLTGYPADMNAIIEIANRHGLVVVEDACQAHGARLDGQRCGTFGNAGCFSFYPGKNLGAFGDGGMVVTNDAKLANRLRSLRHYGQKEKYNHVELGTNSRLDTIQSAVLNVKLPHLDSWNDARANHASEYRKHLANVPGIELPPIGTGIRQVYHLFVIRTQHRDYLQSQLESMGIATGVHYPIPMHLQQAYRHLGHQRGDFPVAERLAEQILSLPMFPEMTCDEIRSVSEAVGQSCAIAAAESECDDASLHRPRI